MAARKRKILHDDETRARIKAGVIIERFMRCVTGDLELNSNQVSCGKALLSKVIPDLQSMAIGGDAENPVKMTFEWLKPSE